MYGEHTRAQHMGSQSAFSALLLGDTKEGEEVLDFNTLNHYSAGGFDGLISLHGESNWSSPPLGHPFLRRRWPSGFLKA